MDEEKGKGEGKLLKKIRIDGLNMTGGYDSVFRNTCEVTGPLLLNSDLTLAKI